MAKHMNSSNPWAWSIPGLSEPLHTNGHSGLDASLLNFPQLLTWGINSYAPAMCLLGLLAIFKTYFSKIKSLLEDHFTSTLHVKATDETYDMVLAWVSSRGLDNLAKSIIARVGAKWKSRDGIIMNGKKPICISPWNGGFWFRFRGTFLSYQTQTVSSGLHKEEVITITCLGRSVQVLKDLIEECRVEYLKQGQNKMTVFKNCGDYWKKTTTREKRPLSTVITSETQKQDLVDDVREFLDPQTQAWYAERGIPYRRGYLLYGPPGTGKSSLVSAVAGEFDLDIRAVSIPSVDDKKLEELFDSLPERCVVLLEDIDAVGTDRSKSPDAWEKKKGMLSLSGLLNTLDGVASRDGRILFMTTNHKDKLDDALIRPGRIDKEFEIKLADENVTMDLFRFIFKHSERYDAREEIAGVRTELDENHASHGKVYTAWLSLIKRLFGFVFGRNERYLVQNNVLEEKAKQNEDHAAQEKAPDTGSDPISQLAAKFATKIPQYEFSTAQIMSHLLQHKLSPEEAIEHADDWVARSRKINSRKVDPRPSTKHAESLEDVLWMKGSNNESPVISGLKRIKEFSDLHLAAPISQPQSPCSSASHPCSTSKSTPLTAVGEMAICATPVPSEANNEALPDSGIGTSGNCGETKCSVNADSCCTDTDFPLNHGASQMTEEDRRILGIQDWGQEDPCCADKNLTTVSASSIGNPLLRPELQRDHGTLHQAGLLKKANFVSTSIEQVVTPTTTTGGAASGNIQTEIKATRPDIPLANGCTLLPCNLGSPFLPFKSNPFEAILPEGTALDSFDSPVRLRDTTQDVPPDTKNARLVSSDSEWPGSPYASGNVSIIPWTDCYPDDPDKAKELATSTGFPGIQVYPVDVFFHASSSQVLDAVDASRNSDRPRAEMKTQISPGCAVDSEIESQNSVRTRHLTGVSDSDAMTGLTESWDTTKDVPASSGFSNWKEGNSLKSDIQGRKSLSSDGVPRAKAKQQTGEQRKMPQGGIGAMKELRKVPTGSVPETQNPGPGDVNIPAHFVHARNNPEVHGSGDIAQCFDSSDFPVEWGTGDIGGIDLNSLLGDITEDKANKPENVLDRNHILAAKSDLASLAGDVDIDVLLDDSVTKMSEDDRRRLYIQGWGEVKSSSADTTLASVSGSDNRSRLLETEPRGGSGARQQARMARNTITVTTSIEQVVSLNTGAAEHSKLQTEVKAIPPSNPDNINAVSCLTPISMTSDDNGPMSTPNKTQTGVAQLRPLPMNVESLRTLELPEAYPRFSSDRDGLSAYNTRPAVCGPGSYKVGQPFDHQIGHSLNDLFDQTKDYGGMDANHGLSLMSECVSEHNTQETPAKNKTQPETGASSSTPVKVSSFSTSSLSVVGTQVSKLCTPSSAKTNVQVELGVEAERPRDDSVAKNADEICGTDVDFDLNCGARKITEEDFFKLGLHKLSWAKLSDAITDSPLMSTADLRGLENASKDSPLLINGPNPQDDSEVNVAANKTGLDITDSTLPANVDSLRNMTGPPSLIDFFGVCGPQESPGDALLDSSPKREAPKADDESVWVNVEVGADNLATYTDM